MKTYTLEAPVLRDLLRNQTLLAMVECDFYQARDKHVDSTTMQQVHFSRAQAAAIRLVAVIRDVQATEKELFEGRDYCAPRQGLSVWVNDMRPYLPPANLKEALAMCQPV